MTIRMKTIRRLRALAPRLIRRREFDISDAGQDLDLVPEVVFDRVTGPFGSRQPTATSGSGRDEEP